MGAYGNLSARPALPLHPLPAHLENWGAWLGGALPFWGAPYTDAAVVVAAPGSQLAFHAATVQGGHAPSLLGLCALTAPLSLPVPQARPQCTAQR